MSTSRMFSNTFVNHRVVLAILTFCLVAVVSYLVFLTSFAMFDVDAQMVTEVDVPNRYTIGVFVVPENATINNFVQLRRLDDGAVLQNYEGYSVVNDCKLCDDTLRLVLGYTGSGSNTPDTLLYAIHAESR